ncbi:replication-relaxation family protein [Patescibacteria group bacterium]|nr:replication-relaxation family protein [Patescibacteria group bacterium]
MAKKEITKQEHTILLLLLIFRFVNSKQLQELFKHKDHRRINSWIKDLELKGYLVREYKPRFGYLNKPAVCYLTAKGRAYLKEVYDYSNTAYVKRLARDKKASTSFKVKCQLVVDCYLAFMKSNSIFVVDYLVEVLKTGKFREASNNATEFFTPACFPPFVLLTTMKPDAYIRKRSKKGITRGLIYIIDAYVPRFLLRYLVKHIFEAFDEEEWEDERSLSLQIYFICPNHVIITYLRKLLPSFLEEFYSKSPLLIYLVTRNELYRLKRGEVEQMKRIILSSRDY